MIDLLERLGVFLGVTGLVRPLLFGGAGALGIEAARHNTDHAPVVVFAAIAVVALGAAVRERGLAVAALGVAATAAFATPSGLGPLLVLTGTVIAARPYAVDRRIASWPEAVDACIALPAIAGLASVASAQPSHRGVAVAAAGGGLILATWWRGPRHGVGPAARSSISAYFAVPVALILVLAPERLNDLSDLPQATTTAGHGIAIGLAVFAIACLIQEVRRIRVEARPAVPRFVANRPPAR